MCNNVTVSRIGNTHTVSIFERDGGTPVLSESFSDSTLNGGKIGIYTKNWYGIEIAHASQNAVPVPEPDSIALVGIAMAGLAMFQFVRRRRTAYGSAV